MTARRAWVLWGSWCALWVFVWAWLTGAAAAGPGPVWPAGVFAGLALLSVLTLAFGIPVAGRALAMALPMVTGPAPEASSGAGAPSYTLPPPRGRHHDPPPPPSPGAVRYQSASEYAQDARRDWGM